MASELVERRVRLSRETAERLRLLAEQRRTSEDEVVAKAVDVLYGLGGHDGADDGSEVREDVTRLSEGALARVWDNEEDAAYDDWRELYGVPAR